MKKRAFYFLPAFALLGLLVSCEEEGTAGDGKTEEQLANYFLTAETIASNSYSVMDQARRDSLVEAGDTTMINKAMVYKIGNTIVVDYKNGEIGDDGITRAGKLSLTETGNYFTSGGSISATFDNYKVEGTSIGGTMSVTNNGGDDLSINVNNLTYGNEFSYTATKTIDWISGFATRKDQTDDIFEISGGSNGTELAKSNTVTATFTEKLRIDRSCTYNVVHGVIDLALTGTDSSKITYNNANLDFITADGCNNKVNITISSDDGASIKLPRTFNGF